MTAEIVEADLQRPEHQRDVLSMTQAYARDPMGNGAPLPPEVAERLVPGLRAHPTTLIFLAYLDGQVAGIATCFRGFSTFYAQPIINIHDLAVLPEHRGAGIGRQLLEAVAARARALGCCKLTLEVQEHNTPGPAPLRTLRLPPGGVRRERGRRPLLHAHAVSGVDSPPASW